MSTPVHKPVKVTFGEDPKPREEVLELHVQANLNELAIFGKDRDHILLSIDSEGIHLYRGCDDRNGLPLSRKGGESGYIKVTYE